jgi:hypothetical protein
MFHDMLNDRVNLVRRNGDRTDGIRAAVTSKSIIVDDGQIVIEEGDRIERRLANGVIESYLVLDTG